MRWTRSVAAFLCLAVVGFVLPTEVRSADKVGPEFLVNTVTWGDQIRPAAATNDTTMLVIWASTGARGAGADNRGVYGQRYTSGGTRLGGEFRVNVEITGDQVTPALVALNDGTYVAVWRSFVSSNDSAIFARRFNSSGIPVGSEFRVSPRQNSAHSPSIAALRNGGFVVLWSVVRSNNKNDVRGQVFSKNGRPDGKDFGVHTTKFGDQTMSAVAGVAGGFVATWMSDQQDGSGWGIYARKFTNKGVGLGPEFRANTPTDNSQSLPSIAPLKGGGFVIAWESRGTAEGIYAQRYDHAGVPLGNNFKANTSAGSDWTRPLVATLKDKGFLVVWHTSDQDGEGDGLYGQEFTTLGARVGAVFQINTYWMRNQNEPSVASLPDGDFFVFWRSNNFDGQHGGIAGQRFTPAE